MTGQAMRLIKFLKDMSLRSLVKLIQIFKYVKVKNDDEAIELIEGFDQKMEARIGMIWHL